MTVKLTQVDREFCRALVISQSGVGNSHNTPPWQLCKSDLLAFIEISVFSPHTTMRLVHNGTLLIYF